MYKHRILTIICAPIVLIWCICEGMLNGVKNFKKELIEDWKNV